MKEILKKFFKVALLIWGGVLLLVWFIRPQVEAYGQATLQFDEAESAYFIQTEDFRADVQEVSGSEEVSAGMLVTYYKTRGVVMKVCSGFVSEDELKATSLLNMRKGCLIGALVVSFIFLLGVIDEHKRCSGLTKKN